jgi:hypothetical protein
MGVHIGHEVVQDIISAQDAEIICKRTNESLISHRKEK